MKIALVKWRDAVRHEADDGEPAKAEVAILTEVGFLIDENEVAVQIGMENDDPGGDVKPGRWRLSIPRGNIIELRVMELDKAFPKRSLIWQA